MYQRFVARNERWRVTVLDESPAEAGLRFVELKIDGPLAYGRLQVTQP